MMNLVGIAIILGSYLGLVSGPIGWAGWAIAMGGWVIGLVPGVRRPGITEQLASLCKLHERGQLTDEEFAQAKERLLPKPPTQ